MSTAAVTTAVLIGMVVGITAPPTAVMVVVDRRRHVLATEVAVADGGRGRVGWLGGESQGRYQGRGPRGKRTMRRIRGEELGLPARITTSHMVGPPTSSHTVVPLV